MQKLLVIDDDRSIRHIIEQAFQQDGLRVLGEPDAQAGLDAVEARRPDVVLLDIMLPQASGLDVLKRIKEIDPKLPVIFITAGGGSDSAIDAMMLGAYDYVLKPLDVPKLRELVAKATRDAPIDEDSGRNSGRRARSIPSAKCWSGEAQKWSRSIRRSPVLRRKTLAF